MGPQPQPPVRPSNRHQRLRKQNAGDPPITYGSESRIVNEEITVAYIKNVLCLRPQSRETRADLLALDVDSEPLDRLLPPLTSSNTIDIELYAFIAVILNNFVQTWYNRITQDQQFVAEIVQIIAHCTRGIEQRLRLVDLETVLLDQLPDLLINHVKVVRMARTRRQEGREESTLSSERTRYHTLRPHVALSPVPTDDAASSEQQGNEVAWCQMLVNRILPLLLPPEDFANPGLTILVSEIFSNMILHNALCGKASEPWLILDGITKVIRTRADREQLPKTSLSANHLEQIGLLDSDSSRAQSKRPLRRFEAVSKLFLSVTHAAMGIWVFLRAILVATMQASSLPARNARSDFKHGRVMMPQSQQSSPSSTETRIPAASLEKSPILSMQIWECLAQLLSLDRRMPWLCGCISLVQWLLLYGSGQFGGLDSRVDRFLSYKVQRSLSNPTWLPPLLHAARNAIFPDNSLASGRVPPNPDEVDRIRRDCAEAIVDAIPNLIRSRYFATEDHDLMREDVESDLSLLDDPYVNKHLIISVVDLLAVHLFPELATQDADSTSGRTDL